MPVGCPLTFTQENNGLFPRVDICVARVNWYGGSDQQSAGRKPQSPGGLFGYNCRSQSRFEKNKIWLLYRYRFEVNEEKGNHLLSFQ